MSCPINTSSLVELILSLEKSREKIAVVAGASRILDDIFDECRNGLVSKTCELNASLAGRLLPLSMDGRSRKSIEYTREIIHSCEGRVIFLSRLEILFHPALRINPLSLLRTLSMELTLVVRWPGDFSDGFLKYAYPQHKEYFSSKPDRLPVVHDSGTIPTLTFTS